MLEVICYTIERVTAHIQKNNDAKVAAALIKILNDHAVDGEPISIKYANNSVASMCFTATHEVEEHVETDECEICIHTLENTTTATATVSSKTNPSTESKTMNTENTANASSTQQAAAPQQPAQAPAAEDNALALKIGKAVLYTAGTGAAIAAGVWAWKKWSSSSSSTTV